MANLGKSRIPVAGETIFYGSRNNCWTISASLGKSRIGIIFAGARQVSLGKSRIGAVSRMGLESRTGGAGEAVGKVIIRVGLDPVK
jgi:hypothetical protein